MKKRLIALCMAIVLILGILPVSVMAEGIGESDYLAAYAKTVTVDGTLDELAWSTHGVMTGGNANRAFGVLWSGNTLYLGVVPESTDTELRVKLGEAEITVTKTGASGIEGVSAVWGANAVEVAIPYLVSSYMQTCALELHMAGTAWSGTLGFDSLERTFLPNLPNRSDSDDSLGHRVTADSYTMYRKYVEGVSNVGNRVDLANFSVSPLGSQTQTATVEFDFEASRMPVTTAGIWIDNYIACRQSGAGQQQTTLREVVQQKVCRVCMHQ